MDFKQVDNPIEPYKRAEDFVKFVNYFEKIKPKKANWNITCEIVGNTLFTHLNINKSLLNYPEHNKLVFQNQIDNIVKIDFRFIYSISFYLVMFQRLDRLNINFYAEEKNGDYNGFFTNYDLGFWDAWKVMGDKKIYFHNPAIQLRGFPDMFLGHSNYSLSVITSFPFGFIEGEYAEYVDLFTSPYNPPNIRIKQ